MESLLSMRLWKLFRISSPRINGGIFLIIWIRVLSEMKLMHK